MDGQCERIHSLEFIPHTVWMDSLSLREAKIGRETLRLKYDKVITFLGLPGALFYQNMFSQGSWAHPATGAAFISGLRDVAGA